MTISQIKIHKDRWNKYISESEVLLAISLQELCVIIDKSHFVLVIQEGVTSYTLKHEPLNEFNKINFSKWHILYDGNELTKISAVGTSNLSKYQETFQSVYDELISPYINDVKDELLRKEVEKKEQEELQELHRLTELKESQSNVLSELDKDGNGEVDVIEGNDFNLLLKKHQKSIVEVDRNYVQQFVKISSYLKTKEKNIQSIFNSIKDTPNQEVLNEYVEILKGDIQSYNLILFNSLNMIVSLVEDEMITFYEIHEQFDTLNMFDSKHEKDISQKLSNIGDGLENLIYEIREMSDSINDSIGELSYVTEDSNRQLTEQLSEINSSIGVNNLLTGIQTYQMYKINKNTKSLNG
jgi:methyl-accepting chemotaxis protein